MSTPTFQHAEIHGSYRDPSLPVAWSAPEHAVWRFSQLSEARKHEVIERKALALGVRAYAYVNAGRWLVSCPFAGCNSAQYASFADRRYHCSDCGNRSVGGQWVAVVWPDNFDQIERTLELRPTAARHWLPGESVQDLLMQDTERKVEE